MEEKFIFFESWERYLNTLEEDKDINYVNAVARAMIQYGLYGKCKTEDQTIHRKIDAVCADLIKSTKSRYAASVKNGKQGGRPKQYDPNAIRALKANGLTIQEIAATLGCSLRTVQRAIGGGEEDEI